MDMSQALLYTFSTIPQTLGAAFGVLAAFVLYRFQAGNAARSELTRQAIEQLPDEPARDKAYALLAGGRDDEFLELVKSVKPPLKPIWQTVVLRKFVDGAEGLGDAQRALRTAFIYTSGLIVYSILMLCLEPVIIGMPALFAEVFLSLGVIVVVVCLFLYWGLIRQLLLESR
jgi:hypothetical protein